MKMEKISKNCFKGKNIKSPYTIHRLALEKKSIYYVNWGIKPAAIYLSMQFIIVMRLINDKKLFFVIK
jgi:hypothetical protein